MKKVQFILLLFITFSMSSCLTIIEEITIRKDGSGSYRFAMDGSQIKEMFGSIGQKLSETAEPDSTRMAVAPDSLANTDKDDKRNETTAQKLAEKQGISHSHAFNDTITFQSGFEFDFQSLSHLQAAMISLKVDDDIHAGSWDEDASISLQGKTFKHKTGIDNFNDFLTEAMKDKQDEEDEEVDGAAIMSMMKMMFKDLEFKTVYHFPDQKIKKCNYKNATLSDDRHSLIIREKPLDENSKSKKKPSELIVRLK